MLEIVVKNIINLSLYLICKFVQRMHIILANYLFFTVKEAVKKNAPKALLL